MSWIRDVDEVSFDSVCAPLKALVDETWSNNVMLRSQLKGGKVGGKVQEALKTSKCHFCVSYVSYIGVDTLKSRSGRLMINPR